VQKRAAEAEVRSQISRLDQAIQAYQLELQGLPGAAPNSYYDADGYLAAPGGDPLEDVYNGLTTDNPPTMTEMMMASLIGGLRFESGPGEYRFDAEGDQLGRGAISLNQTRPQRYDSFLQYERKELAGRFGGNSAATNLNGADSIPEILDAFTRTTPIVYVRANRGAAGIVTLNGTGSVRQNGASFDQNGPVPAQYDLRLAAPYLNVANFGSEHKDVLAGTKSREQVIFEQFATDGQQAVNRDGYVLLSVGPDDEWGTEDDITNFNQ
ncbi:MAG: hypothetical protein ACFCVE_15530, partial [Phycisphaerae bacterium]